MRTLTADTEKVGLRELMDLVRDEPLTVLANGQPAFVVLSAAEFGRLDEHDRIRRKAAERLRETISAIHREAALRGLTEPELDRLMADES